MELNLVERKVRRAGFPVELTAKEFSLLEYLLQANGQCCSRVELLREVWDLSPDVGTNVVDVYVKYLRKKLALSGSAELGQEIIETVRGRGYRIGRGLAKPREKINNSPIAQSSRYIDTASFEAESVFGANDDISSARELCDNCGRTMALVRRPWGEFLSCTGHRNSPPCNTIRTVANEVQRSQVLQDIGGIDVGTKEGDEVPNGNSAKVQYRIGHLANYKYLIARATDVFGDAGRASIWLSTPSPDLGGKVPLKVAEEDSYSLARLEPIFARIEHGIDF